MKIVADQNIPLARELFGKFGDIQCLAGREINTSDIVDADILLVRSVTNVNQKLLEGSNVKFVGSCTIGVDHLDIDYLDRQKIQWANAPGCNANAVVQYVLSAMAKAKPDWMKKTIGIIGCGNIGGRLHQRLKKLGVSCLCYDPLLTAEDNENLVSFEEILQADIITCHTPLTKTGPFPTYHLLDSEALNQLKSDVLLINSGRGAAIDNEALLNELEKRPLSVVLDVWENEPIVNKALIKHIALGTPHIAGYSIEGREQGTFMIYQALCQYLEMPIDSDVVNILTNDKANVDNSINEAIENNNINMDERFNRLLLSCYPIEEDDQRLRQVDNFDGLRKNYISRREYNHFILPKSLHDSPLEHWFNTVMGT